MKVSSNFNMMADNASKVYPLARHNNDGVLATLALLFMLGSADNNARFAHDGGIDRCLMSFTGFSYVLIDSYEILA